MKTNQILENNKFIAEFMGGLYNKQTKFSLQTDEIWLPYHGVCCYTKDSGKCLNYHNDWNWLMRVVEKIENLDCCDYIQISSNIIEIQARLKRGVIFRPALLDVSDSKIESIYNACLKFIKWYNENK